MSLEDRISALVTALEANTDAMQALAAAYRGQLATNPKADGAPTTGNEAPKKPGRPPKAPPPSPTDLANQGADTSTKPSATPASAPAAGAGSAGNDGVAMDPEQAYKELAVLVPEFAAKHGKAKAIGVFTEMGFANGLELKAKAPARIAEAIRLFRSAM